MRCGSSFCSLNRSSKREISGLNINCFVDFCYGDLTIFYSHLGTSLKEAANINTSMMELGRCLKQLREKREFVNFRNSKLTYLFQNVLQGSGRAVMIVNIAPCEHVLQETMNTLKFAAVAQKVTTNAVAASEKPKIKAKRKSMSSKLYFFGAIIRWIK